MYILTLTNSTYYNPSPTRQTILENTARFIHAISKNIEHGSLSDGTVRVHFRHDVYRLLFHDKKQLGLEDFDSTYFSTGWEQTLREYTGQQQTKYTGCRVVFPHCTWTLQNRNDFTMTLMDIGTLRKDFCRDG